MGVADTTHSLLVADGFSGTTADMIRKSLVTALGASANTTADLLKQAATAAGFSSFDAYTKDLGGANTVADSMAVLAAENDHPYRGAINLLSQALTVARASVATYLDSNGVLQSAAANVLRTEYNSSGSLLGLFAEEARTNKCTNFNALPDGGLTNVTKTGDAASTLTRVDDTAELASAGLDVICSDGNVFKLDNTSGVAAANADIGGATGNTNAHFVSAYVRGSGTANVQTTGTATADITLTSVYVRSAVTVAPAGAGDVLRISVDAGDTVFFVLNQMEEAASASSVIVVAGANAARVADDITITLGSWFSAIEGSVLVAGDLSGLSDGVHGNILTFSDGTFDERLDFQRLSADLMSQQVTDGGVLQVNSNAGAKTQGNSFKMACCWKVNDFAKSVDGGAVQTDGAGTIPTVTIASVGGQLNGNFLQGHIKTLRYYPTRLPNASLITLST